MKVLKLVYFFVFSFLYVCMMTGYAWADGQVGHAEMGVSSTSSQSSIEIYDGDNHVIWHPNGETMPSSNSDVQENVNINDRVQNSADMHILNLDDVAQNSTVIIINPTNTQNNINIIIKTNTCVTKRCSTIISYQTSQSAPATFLHHIQSIHN